jgi:hypothetical protein
VSVFGRKGSKWLLMIVVLGAVLYFSAQLLLAHGDSSLPQSAQMSDDQLVGSWTAPGGGLLTLQKDGLFTAVDVCGFGATSSGVGSDAGKWETGNGEWLSLSTGRRTSGVSFSGKISSAELDEGVASNQDVLWMFVGPPDESRGTCQLHKAS